VEKPRNVCDATLVRRAISRLGDQLFEVQCAFEHRQGSEGALSVAKLLKALLDLRLSEDDAAFALERYGKVFTFPVDFSCFLQIYADVTGLLRKSKGHSDDDEDGRMWVEYAPAKWKPLSPRVVGWRWREPWRRSRRQAFSPLGRS
jgi:hypothetical protein